jgi:putative zinc finger protein
MRCDDCQLVIEEYFDGELNEQTALRVRRHIDGCPSCSRVLQNLTTEQAVYVAGRSEIQIRPDLWSGVRARLALEQQAEPSGFLRRLQTWLSSAFVLPRISGLTAVALVILAVGLTMLLMRYGDRSLGDQTLTSVSESPPKATPHEEQTMLARGPAAAGPRSSLEGRQSAGKNAAVESIAAGRKSKPPSRRIETIGKVKTPEQLVREAEQKYLTAIAMLSRTVERKRARLDVGTLAKLEQALASIDRTIADTRRAVRQHPDDPVAVQYMLTAYAKKVDVLREMAEY